ncbi:hypothetical protein GCM10027203_76510 [Nonomuraea fastidiosa]
MNVTQGSGCLWMPATGCRAVAAAESVWRGERMALGAYGAVSTIAHNAGAGGTELSWGRWGVDGGPGTLCGDSVSARRPLA